MSRSNDHSYPFVFPADSPLIGVYRTLEKVLDSPTTVLIEGESGTGKDGLAQWLHYNSPRKDGPYIKIDFASLPEDLVESELFGYERGAFTGAVNSKLGKLDLAQSGTAVLDEIASIDLTRSGQAAECRRSKTVLPARRNTIDRTGYENRRAVERTARAKPSNARFSGRICSSG